MYLPILHTYILMWMAVAFGDSSAAVYFPSVVNIEVLFNLAIYVAMAIHTFFKIRYIPRNASRPMFGHCLRTIAHSRKNITTPNAYVVF